MTQHVVLGTGAVGMAVADSTKFENTFGVTATPLDEAIPATVAWYRANPEE